MTVRSLIRAATTASPGRSEMVTVDEAQDIVDAARTDADRERIKAIDKDKITEAANRIIKKYLRTGSTTTPTTQSKDVELQLRAKHKVWTCTYWPTAGDLSNPNGDPEANLWAKGGVLDKFDQVLDKLGKKTGALKYEKRPYFAGIVGSDRDAGHYIPSGTIKEGDAERTTGVDLDGDGKIEPNVKYDMLTGEYLGEYDGQTDGEYDVSWFGECDNVAGAATMFAEPKRAVTFQGVTFTPNQIKGLLVLIAESQMEDTEFALQRYDGAPDTVRTTDGKTLRGTIENLDLKDFRSGKFKVAGNVVTRHDYDKPITITLLDGSTKKIPVEKQAAITRESEEDSAATFHDTMKAWLSEKRPFCMDHDSGSHVWNDSYDGANIKESAKLPRGVRANALNGCNGAYKGGTLTCVTTELLQGDDVAQTYRYWIEVKNGKVVNSGWLDSNVPDFMWRPTNDKATFTGKNARNPFVDPAIVKQIYERSI